jgi:hypothetical protein
MKLLALASILVVAVGGQSMSMAVEFRSMAWDESSCGA